MADEHTPDNLIEFHIPSNSHSDTTRAAMYEYPWLDWRDDGRCTMIDIFGNVMVLQTLFLNHLHGLYARQSYLGMSRMLLDITRILAAYRKGQGLELSELDDAFLLDRLRPEFLVHRGVTIETFRRNMRVLFRCILFGQRHGFFSGVIGSDADGINYRLNLPLGKFKDHPVMVGRGIRNIPRVPSHNDLDIVEAETMSLMTSASIRRRFQIITKTARPLAFRRSELANMTTSLIPTRHELAQLRAAAESGRRGWTIAIPIERAKGGGTRTAHFHIGLLEEIREFIETDRNDHLKPGVETDAIFVSTKSGRALSPSYFTNILKRGARKAAAMHPREFGDLDLRKIHPHHYRHRGATDMLLGFLHAGMQPLEAVLTTMDALGIKSFKTISIYLHLAQAELNSTRPSAHPDGPTSQNGGFDRTEHDLAILHELANSGDKKRRGVRV